MLAKVSGAALKREEVKAERLTESTVSGSFRSNCFPSVAGLFVLPAECCNQGCFEDTDDCYNPSASPPLG